LLRWRLRQHFQRQLRRSNVWRAVRMAWRRGATGSSSTGLPISLSGIAALPAGLIVISPFVGRLCVFATWDKQNLGPERAEAMDVLSYAVV
jgi:hypothetical protein